MVPSKIKIESFAKHCHMGTLGGKGLITIDHARIWQNLFLKLNLFYHLFKIIYNFSDEILFRIEGI